MNFGMTAILLIIRISPSTIPMQKYIPHQRVIFPTFLGCAMKPWDRFAHLAKIAQKMQTDPYAVSS